jgi:hypothetical protein
MSCFPASCNYSQLIPDNEKLSLSKMCSLKSGNYKRLLTEEEESNTNKILNAFYASLSIYKLYHYSDLEEFYCNHAVWLFYPNNRATYFNIPSYFLVFNKKSYIYVSDLLNWSDFAGKEWTQ